MTLSQFSSWSLGLAILLTLPVLEGCGTPPPVPPAFNLYGYKSLAVVPFENQSPDPDLPVGLSEEMTDELAGLNALPIIQASQVAVFLKSQKAAPSDLLTSDPLRQALQARFKCDLLMMGTAQGFSEILKDDAPVRQTGSDGQPQWGFTTHRKSIVDASFKLLDASTGNLLWSRKNKGYSWHNTWNPLPVPPEVVILSEIDRFIHLPDLFRHRLIQEGDQEPMTMDQNDLNILIYPNSHGFRELRSNAIHQTVYDLVEDFRGHEGWLPKGPTTP